jgi:hypothetical protein
MWLPAVYAQRLAVVLTSASHATWRCGCAAPRGSCAVAPPTAVPAAVHDRAANSSPFRCTTRRWLPPSRRCFDSLRAKATATTPCTVPTRSCLRRRCVEDISQCSMFLCVDVASAAVGASRLVAVLQDSVGRQGARRAPPSAQRVDEPEDVCRCMFDRTASGRGGVVLSVGVARAEVVRFVLGQLKASVEVRFCLVEPLVVD